MSETEAGTTVEAARLEGYPAVGIELSAHYAKTARKRVIGGDTAVTKPGGGRLPVHVRFLLDEFANIKIPQMQRTISVLRSRECSVSLAVQTMSKGNSPSYGKNYQKLGKDLMSMDELSVMDGSMSILQLRGVHPFLSRKYDITQHRCYKYLADHDPRNAFNVEKHLSTRLRARPEEAFEFYDISA